MLMKSNRIIITAASITGILASVADFLVEYILAAHYPGYSHLTDTFSKLGSTASPVGRIISYWWMIYSVLIVFFGYGFYLYFKRKGKPGILAAWLVIIYALGEGMGSGLFPANYLKHGFTLSLIIHDTFSGIGIGCIIILPIVMMQIFPKEKHRSFYTYSIIVTAVGLVMLVFFSLAKIFDDPRSVLLGYKGLWQRLMLADYYLFLIVIAFCMLFGINSFSTKSPD